MNINTMASVVRDVFANKSVGAVVGSCNIIVELSIHNYTPTTISIVGTISPPALNRNNIIAGVQNIITRTQTSTKHTPIYYYIIRVKRRRENNDLFKICTLKCLRNGRRSANPVSMYNSNTNDNNNDNIFGEDAGPGVCRLRRGARARRLGVDRVIKVYGRKKIRKKGHCFAFSEREIITLEPGPANGLYAADDVTAPASVRWSARVNVAGQGASVMERGRERDGVRVRE